MSANKINFKLILIGILSPVFTHAENHFERVHSFVSCPSNAAETKESAESSEFDLEGLLMSDEYQLPQWVGLKAKELGYKGIIYRSARAPIEKPGANIVLFGKANDRVFP